MPRRSTPPVTEQTTVGPDLDLDRDDIRLPGGRRLTQSVADTIVEQVRQAAGRPSLSGARAASPQIAFRVAPSVREKAAQLAAREGKTISQLAREALEARVEASR
jgi:predicted HicB family RNase H-like nuclease